MGTGDITIREATAGDLGVLLTAGLEAMNWGGEASFTLEQFLATPKLSHYIDGWPKDGDFGVIAETISGAPAGAAWCRIFTANATGYGFVAPDIPELTIAAFPGHRGKGVGTALMEGLIAQATARGLTAISLSVEDGNRARLLYERMGFRKVGRNGGSDTLLLDLQRSSPNAPAAAPKP